MHAAVDAFGRDAGKPERLGHMLGVLAADAEGERQAVADDPSIVLDGIASHGRLVHLAGELLLVVVAPHRLDAAQVDLGRWAEQGIRRQCLALDQRSHRGADHHRAEHVAKPCPVRPLWRRRDAEDLGRRVGVDDLAVRRGKRVVRLVDHNEIRRCDLVEPPHDGANHGDLHRQEIARSAGHDQAVLDPEAVKRPRRLLDQLSAMHENEAALAKPLRGRDDVGERYGFT